MFELLTDRKLLHFGLAGAIGCLVGWLVGEPFLALALPDDDHGAPSLVSRPEPAPLPPEFKTRLDAAGASTGDVQVSLIWDNTNDLDLHCIDPSGREIFWKQRYSATGGHLDVDRNAGCASVVPDPVENIYWPKGGAPRGEYRIDVNYYSVCDRSNQKTPFRVNVLVGNERKEFSGTAGEVQERQTVYSFRVDPELDLFPATQEVELGAGETFTLPVEVYRIFFDGPVKLTVKGLPEGWESEPVTVPPGADKAKVTIEAGSSPPTGPIPIQLVGTAAEANAEVELRVVAPSWWSWGTILTTGIWTALLAAGLALALAVGQRRYLGRRLFGDPKLPLIVLGSAAVGIGSGAVGQALQFIFAAVGLPWWLGFLAGWTLLGGLVGAGVSFFIPNLDGKKSAIAGSVGGVVGVIGFLTASMVLDILGRFAGAAILGFCIGLMVALVEAAFRRAWLEVRFGSREMITVNLGPEPVKVGSDGRACTVWARDAAPIELRYFIREGKVICHDVPANTERPVTAGDTRSLGDVELTVRAGGTTAIAAPVPAVTTPRTPPPPPPVAKSPRPAPVPTPVAATAVADPAKPTVRKPAAPAVKKVTGGENACPECGRKVTGKPGSRYCLVCDRTF